MIDVDIIDRMIALAAVAPFDRLTERELLMVAQHVRPRHFEAGAMLIEQGHVADMLYVAIGGSALAGTGAGAERAPALFDAPSLLFTLPAAHDYRAGPDGFDALCLARPYIFTIARECPDFIVGLIDIEALAR